MTQKIYINKNNYCKEYSKRKLYLSALHVYCNDNKDTI